MKQIYSLSTAVVSGALFLFAWQLAGAADAGPEISTAATHAGMAAGSTDEKMVKSHLHHVINCLVGPNGADYDANEANPCKSQGMGALVDAPAKKSELEAALADAKAGLAETDMTKSKAKAVEAQNALKKAGL